MAHTTPGVADIFRHAGPAYRDQHAGALDATALKVMDCIERCRTPALGGTLFRCTDCGHVHAVWKSCGNRHCPTCQGAAAHRWMTRQAASLLPVPYFHVVFTLPRAIARIAMQNRTIIFNIMFRAAAETLRTISADPRRLGARIGGTAVLHTWNQKLQWHPHLHCLVPNGGFDIDTGAWKVGSDRFFAPVKVLASCFRRRVIEELGKAHAGMMFHGAIADLADPRAFSRLLKQARQTSWNVYAKQPFHGPEAVVRYLSRYTHRIAISDRRILAFNGTTVTMRHRRPVKKHGDTPTYGSMHLAAGDFIRRFLILRIPVGFHRIRHFGILANGCRARTMQAVPQNACAAAPDDSGPTRTPADAGHDELTGPLCPACPLCGSPSLTAMVLEKGATDQDLARTLVLIRQRGPPRWRLAA